MKIDKMAVPALERFQAKTTSKLARTMETIGSDISVEKPASYAALFFARLQEPAVRFTRVPEVKHIAKLRGEEILVSSSLCREYISVDKRGEEIIKKDG